MDSLALLTLIDSTIDKIFSLAARYNVRISVDKEELKKQVHAAALSDKAPPKDSIIYKFIYREQLDPVVARDKFKSEFVAIMKDLISMLNRNNLNLNTRAIVYTLATSIKLGEAMDTIKCPNCNIEYQDNAGHMCPKCKYQVPQINANVNALGAVPTGRLVRKPVTAREVLEACDVAWRGC